MPKIYADQRWIGKHGIGRFAHNLLAELCYDPVALNGSPASPFDSIRLSWALRDLKESDVFFSPGYNSPLFLTAPFIFSIHDLNHIDRTENTSLSRRLYYQTLLRRASQRAAKIITVSEFSRNRIVQWSGVSRDKVVNVGCGVDPSYCCTGPPSPVIRPYLLCVSNRKGHKNEVRVVKSFARARVSREFTLIFTGTSTPEMLNYISAAGIQSRTRFMGTVADDTLPALYRGARALIFPSLYEGFGLPVLESMACGTPVLTSNSSALPEVAGGAALLVDPTSIEQISTAIDRISTDISLREELIQKGLVQASQYTWGKTVAKLIEVIQSVRPDISPMR